MLHDRAAVPPKAIIGGTSLTIRLVVCTLANDEEEPRIDGGASGTGLRIMLYRAGLIRAKLTIGPSHPRGTQVTCTLPRQQESWPASDPDARVAFSPKPETVDSRPRAE